eukprot:19486-Pelagococcus_subviridis.AAC.2
MTDVVRGSRSSRPSSGPHRATAPPVDSIDDRAAGHGGEDDASERPRSAAMVIRSFVFYGVASRVVAEQSAEFILIVASSIARLPRGRSHLALFSSLRDRLLRLLRLLLLRLRLLRRRGRLLAHEPDHPVRRRDVRARRRDDDVRVRARRGKRPRLHLAAALRLHRDAVHRPHPHARLRQGLDPLHDRVDAVLHELHLARGDDAVDGFVRRVHGARANLRSHSAHPVRAAHLHRRGREAHRAAHDLDVLELPRRGLIDVAGELAALARHQRDDLVVVHAARLLLRDELEPVEHLIQRVPLERVPQLFELRRQRVPPGVFAHDDADGVFAAEVSDRLRGDDLVGFFVLQHAVLVNARLVREGVGADDRLVRLHAHPGEILHHLAARVDVHGVDARERSVDGRFILPAEPDGHRDFFEARVARALPDAVDGALHLPRAVRDARERVRGGQSEVVLAVCGYDVLARDVFFDPRDERPEFLREAHADGVGNVQRRRARVDDGGQDPVQKLRVRPPGVLGGELHVIAP